MKAIRLTGKYAVGDYTHCFVSEIDYDRVSKHSWCVNLRIKEQWATPKIGIKAKINGKNVALHRFIMNVSDPKIEVDHINYNRLDNTRENLQLLNKKQHSIRQRPRKNSTSQYLGVFWEKSTKKWRADISHNYKCITIGRFNNEIEAAKAYDKKAKELHGSFASLNFPDEITRQKESNDSIDSSTTSEHIADLRSAERGTA